MVKRAASIVKNRADAEDVVQEALERAWRSRERFIAGSKPAPWLMKITQNVALNFLRRESAIDRGSLDEIEALNRAADIDVVKREDSRSIASAIRKLAPAQRQAFVLHDLHGYSSREISMRVHVPYATVRTHLFRARRQLRTVLTGVQ
jgi:RNA polymerase sigma-70 factor (ECF subfamily)